jgi:hypothetical protein
VQGFSPTRFGRTLYARNLFDSFSQRFSRQGDTRISGSGTGEVRALSPNFEVTDALVAEFRAHVEKAGVRIDEPSWQKDLDFIRAMIRFEIDVDLFGVAVASENLAKRDPQLQYGISLFGEAQQLLDLGRPAATGRRAASR